MNSVFNSRKIAVFGCTGSIGRQALSVIRETPSLRCTGLACGKNVRLMELQAQEFDVFDTFSFVERGGKYFSLTDFASRADFDLLLVAVAVTPECYEDAKNSVIAALERGKTVAIASKELIVLDGEAFFAAARGNATLLPVDSEHSAIFQCLRGADGNPVKKIYLTASGGAFRDFSAEELSNVTPEQALAHPVWKMGKKVTVDSATLMNKGLEIVEAIRLFGVEPEQVEVLIHRESIVHSMVEYRDGSVVAQLGVPDMRTPILYALTFPERCAISGNGLNFSKINRLNFSVPDTDRFPCLTLAVKAYKIGLHALTALLAADDIAVSLFLEGKIRFTSIATVLEDVLEHFAESNPRCTGYSGIYQSVRKYIFDIMGLK